MEKDHNIELDAPKEETLIDIEAGLKEEISEVDRLTQDLAQMKDQLLRTLAEAENVRKRAAKDLEESAKYAVTGFAREMLGVSDNLQRALASVASEQLEGNETLSTFVQGVQLTAQSLEAVLTKFHVTGINPVGEAFAPEWHQAMLEVAHDTIKPGHVVEVLQVGYRIHDRLLRPALVSVSK